MDNYITLSSRLLNRCPNIGPELSRQFINDAWHTLQARREWSFRRRHSTFAPPNMYQTGSASTNVANGSPTLITGVGTVWTPDMIGRQIRIGGLLYPYYTIVGWLAADQILLDQPWAGADVALQSYQILGVYYPVPEDFGYFYSVVSVKDGYRLWTNITESDIDALDPQRTNYGQTYAIAFRDYTPIYGGAVGPVIPVTNLADPAPISTTSTGFNYPANATYIVQVVIGGTMGNSTFQWMRAGQTAFQLAQPTSDQPIDLSDGVQIYWPDGVNYIAGDLFIINCTSLVSIATPRYELWPAPTFNGYLYPYIYIAKEYDLTVQSPQLPPFIANRGEVLLEAALVKCAEYPGADSEHPNVYYNLKQASYHNAKLMDMLIDLERNDEEVGVNTIDYESYPFYPAPWATGQWQQGHAPFLNG